MLTLQQSRFDQPPGPLPVRMSASDATAARLLKLDNFAADLIRFPAGGRVADHTHPGDHILFVLSGTGWVDYDGTPHLLAPGDCYLIPGAVRHGIRGETELTLLAVANNHRDAVDPERLTPCS